MPTKCSAKHYVAVNPALRRPGAGTRGLRNICANATFSYKCCTQHLYDYRGTSRPVPAAPFPRWAAVMADRLRAHFAGSLPVQCIVNEYRPGQGIGMHADHRDFGPVVASLSLGADWPMRFRPRASRPYVAGALPGDEVALLPRRSVLVLAGAARHRFMHGIDRRMSARETATRVSATFRTLAA